jgi:hypothetical protein
MRAVESVISSASSRLVWSVLSDVEHWSEWTSTVIEIRPLDGEGLRVGARYRVVQPKLRPATYEVTACVPNQRFTWVQKVLGGAMIADHRLVPCSGGSKVELSFSSEGFAANIVASLFSRIIREYVATEAKSLKRRCDQLASEEFLGLRNDFGHSNPVGNHR